MNRAPESADHSALACSGTNKARLPSRHTTIDPECAPHRSFLDAIGLTARDIAQPFVSVVTT